MGDFAGIFVLALTGVANLSFLMPSLSPVLRLLFLWAVIFNIKIRLHPDVLRGVTEPAATPGTAAAGKPGAEAPQERQGPIIDLSWPSPEIWRWLGMVTSFHQLAFIIKTFAPALLAEKDVTLGLIGRCIAAVGGIYYAFGFFIAP